MPWIDRRGTDLQLYSFFNFSCKWSGWLPPRPGRFNPRNYPVPKAEEAGWALGLVWTREEIILLHRNSIPGHAARSVVAIPTTLSPALIHCIWQDIIPIIIIIIIIIIQLCNTNTSAIFNTKYPSHALPLEPQTSLTFYRISKYSFVYLLIE
jgi:hypothetical protein